nr:hypothetical protein [Alistipes sp.]
MLEHGADQIVLGCTHYPFLLPVLERVVAGRGVTVVDPSPAVARRVVQLLDRYGLHADPPTARNIRSAPLPTRPTASAWNARPWGTLIAPDSLPNPILHRDIPKCRKMRNFA